MPHNSSAVPDPIALVGIGCRFPGGAHSPQSFWELLKTGSDAIVDVPPDRWNWRRFYSSDTTKLGKMYVKQGGFIQQRIDEFDALFFGIAPREAESMDPQQRLLLETSWEALEDAGIPSDTLAGSNTGVFIGAFTLDHKLTQMSKMNRHLIGTHTAVGSTMTILSNRISYVFDLRGPSVSLDTACSSSLVAFHLACQAIWHGECDLALAGGGSVMLRPEYPIAMCKGGFLAPDARSKSFDASANGYGRGEGAGVVVLKPLSAALRDGDSIYALVRGTGVNQDGRTHGITVPNPESQTQLIHDVCRRYDVNPDRIHYIEAHGTGTPVGDPLEAKALSEALGRRDSSAAPCLVGSAKATIGHLEAAAGVAGVIKAALCLAHRQVPPQANLTTPNPTIPFAELGLRLPRQLETLAPGVEDVCAAVNSFGYGGTNAHAILATCPRLQNPPPPAESDDRVHVLPLSARSEPALAALVSAWLERFATSPGPSLADLCYSAACRRSHQNYRLAVTGMTWAEMRERLQLFATQGSAEGLASSRITGETQRKPVFVYTGMGPQWWGMGRDLYAHEPAYKHAVEACDHIFRRLAGWSVLAAMLADEGVSDFSDTTLAQPANLLIQVGLTALWKSLGIEPAAIVGHSVGEVSAAYAAGVLTLEDAVMVSYHRSRIQKKAAGVGKMLAVGVSREYCEDLIAPTDGEVSIAAINGPTSITLAGNTSSLEAIANYLTKQGEFNRFLQVEVAYHSPSMEPLKPELRAALDGLQPLLPKLPLYSTVSGKLVTEPLYDAEYWCNNIREPVRFADAMANLLADGHRVFLEVGPHPVLSTAVKECSSQQDVTAHSIATLRKDKPERPAVKLALAELYVAGCAIDWSGLTAKYGRYVKLPSYPWQREKYWIESLESTDDRVSTPIHPLLDRRIPDPRPGWRSTANQQFLPYLKDHQVDGLVVMPGAAYVEAGLAAWEQLTGDARCTLEQLVFHQALLLNSGGSEPTIQVNLDPEIGIYQFHSRELADQTQWQLHASAKVHRTLVTNPAPVNPQALRERCVENLEVSGFYDNLAQRGLCYGPCFQSVRQLHRGSGEIVARIELPPDLVPESTPYHLHPVLLDGCFQSLLLAVKDSDHVYLPIAIKRLTWHQRPGNAFWCHGKITRATRRGIVGNLTLFDESGQVLVELEGLRCRILSVQRPSLPERLARWGYAWKWLPQALPPSTPRAGCWLVLKDGSEVGESLCRSLRSSQNQVIEIPLHRAREQGPDQGRCLQTDELQQLHAVLQHAKECGCTGVVYLWGLAPHDQQPDPVGTTRTGIALQVVQMLAGVFETHAPRLYMVTSGAQAVTAQDTIPSMAQTPLIGFSRVAFNEYPVLRCTLVDLDNTNVSRTVDALSQELLSDDPEDDVAFRDTQRYVHRLERLQIDPVVAPPPLVSGTEVPAVQLESRGQPGFRSSPITSPLPGEVTVRLDAVNLTGVNLAGADDSDAACGYFAVGVISDVGSAVADWRRGDRVMVAAEGTPASSVTCSSARLFSVQPFPGLAHTEIAALTTTLLPAYYALKVLARATPGETVLIDGHLSSGSRAATFIASRLALETRLYGADVSTASAEPGESLITVDAPDFPNVLADIERRAPIRAWLHGPNDDRRTAIAKLLPPSIQEIVVTNAADAGEPKEGWCSCSVVNALSLAWETPEVFGQLLLDLGQLLAGRGPEFNLATEISPTEAVARLSADQTLPTATASVLRLREEDRASIQVASEREPFSFDSDATFLITGGFGGFGLEAAHWLAKQGARHLVLVGRSGAASPKAQSAVRQLEQRGVKVLSVAADIADRAHVVALLERVRTDFPPLKGILHAAGVLDDAPIVDLDPSRMTKVLVPKALGAWHLHELTQSQPLEFFLLFSSVSALIGNARQANYAAANTFMDALATHRKALGLPATAINWGAIKTGMALENSEVQQHLEMMGMYSLTVEEAMSAWLHLRDSQLPQYGLINCDWSRWQTFEPAGGNSPRFQRLMDGGAPQEHLLTELCQTISELPQAARLPAMSQALAEQIAKVLRMPMSRVDLQQSLPNMGVDSLMSVELQAKIHQVFGARISTLELTRGRDIGHLAELLMERTVSAIDTTEPVTRLDEPSVVDRMSVEEVDTILSQLLIKEEQ